MTGFNHTLVGGLTAVAVPVPLAPVIALASHFVLDALPHFGNSRRIRPYTPAFIAWLAADALLCVAALALALWLHPGHWWITILCVGLATLPDFLWLAEGRVQWLNHYFTAARRIQWAERPWAWTLELSYGFIFATWLLFLSY